MIDRFDIQIFIDHSLEKISKYGVKGLGIAEKDFLDKITPHMDKSDPLSEIPFEPQLVPYLFKGWTTGEEYTKKDGDGSDAIYQVVNKEMKSELPGTVNVVFWLLDNKTEYRIPINQTIEKLPTNMSEFVAQCWHFDLPIKLKTKPYEE